MQKLITKYGLAAHLALVAVAPLFLSPAAVLCLAVLGAIWLVMEPSRIGGEMLHDARRRVTRAMTKDPLFWVSLVLVIVSVLRMFNVGVGMTYDAEVGKWSVSDAVWPLMPASVEGGGFALVGCAVAMFVVVQGCRHCLGRSARGAFALVASLLSGIGGFVEVYLCEQGVASLVEASQCALTNPTFNGSAYGVFLVFAVVGLVAAFEGQWFRVMPLSIFGVGGNVLGLFVFAPPAVAVAHGAVALIILIYAFIYIRLRLPRTTEFKYFVIFGLGVGLAALAICGICSVSFVEARTELYMTGAFVPEGYLETRATLSDIAARIWKARPWLGYGYASFPLDLQFNALPAEWEVVTPLQKAVPNGYWMILAERGVIGAFFLAAPVVLLAVTYVRRLVSGVTQGLSHPLAWAGLLVVIVAALEMLVDNSFLAPGAAVALVTLFSISAAAFPKEKRSHG